MFCNIKTKALYERFCFATIFMLYYKKVCSTCDIAHPNLRLPDLTVTASVMVPMPGVTALIATQARPLRRHGGRRRLLQACQWHASAWSHLLAGCGRACGGGF